MTATTETTNTPNTKPATFKGQLYDPDQLIIVGLDTNDGPEHPLYDERIHLPISQGMVANIRYRGVLIPVKYVLDGDKAYVVDGRRRVIHARLAKQLQLAAGEEPVKVPAIQTRASGADLFGISIAANRMRVDDNVLTNARNAERLIAMGKSVEEIALDFDVSDQAVRNWLACLKLGGSALEALKSGEITATAALDLAALPVRDQEAIVAEVRTETAKDKANGVPVKKADVSKSVAKKAREKAGKTAAATPAERIKKARSILERYATGTAPTTKDDIHEVVDKLCKALLSMGLERLKKAVEEE